MLLAHRFDAVEDCEKGILKSLCVSGCQVSNQSDAGPIGQ